MSSNNKRIISSPSLTKQYEVKELTQMLEKYSKNKKQATRRPKDAYTLLGELKHDFRSVSRDVSQIFKDPHARLDLSGSRNMLWRLTAAIAAWPYRQYITVAALGLAVKPVLALMIIGFQASVAFTVISGRVISAVQKTFAKMTIACMRILRKSLQLPFDIPASLYTIARGELTPEKAHVLLEESVQQYKQSVKKNKKK